MVGKVLRAALINFLGSGGFRLSRLWAGYDIIQSPYVHFSYEASFLIQPQHYANEKQKCYNHL